MRAPRVVCIAFLSFLVAACADSSTDPLQPNLNVAASGTDSEWVCCGLRVLKVEVTPTTATLAAGDSIDAKATLRTIYNWVLDPREPGRLVRWTSADTSVVRAVSTGRATARLVAVGGGTAKVTAYNQGHTATISVTVSGAAATPTPTQPPRVASLVIAPAADTLTPGQKARYVATAKDSAGAVLHGLTVAWSLSDSSVATLSARADTGVVTGLVAGSVTVRATTGGKTAAATVMVRSTVQTPAPDSTITPTPTPTPTPGMRVGYYVSPAGSASGDGSYANPWDLATALAQPAAVQPGDTVWVLGGTYKGRYTSHLTGAPGTPIVLRQYPGQRATIDGSLLVLGGSTVYWGFEVMDSDASRPAIIGVNVKGPNTKFVNLVVHDHGDNGFGFWSEAPDAEIYGSIIYNNGRQSNTRGSAHGIYAQNGSGRKRIVDNVLFNQFAYGIHVYGSNAVQLKNFHIEGNASFTNGTSAINGAAPDILVGGGSAASGIVVKDNYTFRKDGGTTAVFGYNWGPVNDDLQLLNNYVVGSTNILKWNDITASGNTFTGAQTVMMLTMASGLSTSRYNWHDNHYIPAPSQWSAFNLMYAGGGAAGYDLAGWQSATGLDQGSTYRRGQPSGTKVFVRPNQYERGRANVIVYNWDRASSVSVDLSGVLPAGTRYEVHPVQDFYGTPVASGTYSGGSITIPVSAVQPPRPIGGPVTPASTGVEFNVYVVVPIG
ncbi:MAG TPA: right-handed parallel beta-helix repeat-containing protein [Gemmatimonadaceae bacterium]|nr:right-handed parallel beta-helix repeat-containing protein [Gemmatimonadaceae bacterium]